MLHDAMIIVERAGFPETKNDARHRVIQPGRRSSNAANHGRAAREAHKPHGMSASCSVQPLGVALSGQRETLGAVLDHISPAPVALNSPRARGRAQRQYTQECQLSHAVAARVIEDAPPPLLLRAESRTVTAPRRAPRDPEEGGRHTGESEEARVAQGPGRRRRELRAPAFYSTQAEARDGLRGGALPEHRGMLGAAAPPRATIVMRSTRLPPR